MLVYRIWFQGLVIWIHCFSTLILGLVPTLRRGIHCSQVCTQTNIHAHRCNFFLPPLYLLISQQGCYPSAVSISGNQRITNNSTVSYDTWIVLSIYNLTSHFLISPRFILPSIVHFLLPLNISITPHNPPGKHCLQTWQELPFCDFLVPYPTPPHTP